jgi:hypothetical protein
MARMAGDTGGSIVVNGQTLEIPAVNFNGTPNSFEGGINGNVFEQFAQQGAGGAQGFTIPVWRDRYLNNDGTFASGATASGSANAAEARMGSRRSVGSANALENSLTSAGSVRQMTEDQAILQFANILQDPDMVKSWAQIALEAGLITPDQTTDASALGRAWETAVGWALKFKEASGGSIDMTPFEAAQKVAQNTGSAEAAKQAYAAQHFTGDKTFVNESISDVEPDVSTLHDLLGRDPSEGELAAYRHGVSETARANPVKTTTTTSYEDGQAVSQQAVSTGGFDKQQAEMDAARAASPEVAEFQAASTYYNALVQALGSAV